LIQDITDSCSSAVETAAKEGTTTPCKGIRKNFTDIRIRLLSITEILPGILRADGGWRAKFHEACGGDNGRNAIEWHLDVRILADITPLTAQLKWHFHFKCRQCPTGDHALPSNRASSVESRVRAACASR
jgi:hypothetical protein